MKCFLIFCRLALWLNCHTLHQLQNDKAPPWSHWCSFRCDIQFVDVKLKMKHKVSGWMQLTKSVQLTNEKQICERRALFFPAELIYPLMPNLSQLLLNFALWMNLQSVWVFPFFFKLLFVSSASFRVSVHPFLLFLFYSLHAISRPPVASLWVHVVISVSVCVWAECQGQMGRQGSEQVYLHEYTLHYTNTNTNTYS